MPLASFTIIDATRVSEDRARLPRGTDFPALASICGAPKPVRVDHGTFTGHHLAASRLPPMPLSGKILLAALAVALLGTVAGQILDQLASVDTSTAIYLPSGAGMRP